MKVIHYTYLGTPVALTWSEANEAIAAREADNGEYTVTDETAEEPAAI